MSGDLKQTSPVATRPTDKSNGKDAGPGIKTPEPKVRGADQRMESGSASSEVNGGDRYEDLEILGEGGMGKVYRSRDRRLDRMVALKRLLPKMAASKIALKRFLTEAKAVAALNHPNIVQIYDIGRDTQGYYISMELVEGPTLQDRIQTERRIGVEEAVDLTVHLADALHLAHGHGIIHRDIKPANVLCCTNGVPKLTDFGLARRLEVSHRTIAGTLLGTIEFVAPEQRENASKATQASDQYSLAGMFYYMVTGKLPLVIRPELLPEPVREVILQALEQEPDGRYPSTQEFGEALREAAANGQGGDQAPQAATPGRCPECGTQNDAQRKFCAECGADLFIACFSCGCANLAMSRFCGNCGLDLRSRRQELTEQLDRMNAEAAKVAAEGAIERALALYQRVSQMGHAAFRAQRSTAQQGMNQLLADKTRMAAYYQRIYQRAMGDFYAGEYAKVVEAVCNCPTPLRQKQLLQLGEQAQQMVNRIGELNTQLKAAVAARDIQGVLRLLDKLEPLEPKRQDLKRLRQEALRLLNGSGAFAAVVDPSSSGGSPGASSAVADPSGSVVPPGFSSVPGGDPSSSGLSAGMPSATPAPAAVGSSTPTSSVSAPTGPSTLDMPEMSSAAPTGSNAPDPRPAAAAGPASLAGRVKRLPLAWIATSVGALVLALGLCWALGGFEGGDGGPRILAPHVIADQESVSDVGVVSFPARLGQDVELGDLQVKPTGIRRHWLRLVDAADKVKPTYESVLVLTLEAKNKGEHAFAPLDKGLARTRINSYIELADGKRIGLYPLDVASEHNIKDQFLGKIEPRERASLMVVADKKSARAVEGPATWYVHLRCDRIGASAILAIPFTPESIK